MYTKDTSQLGIGLIELIMFIVIISFAISGILLVMHNVTGHSADALVRKQALAMPRSDFVRPLTESIARYLTEVLKA